MQLAGCLWQVEIYSETAGTPPEGLFLLVFLFLFLVLAPGLYLANSQQSIQRAHERREGCYAGSMLLVL